MEEKTIDQVNLSNYYQLLRGVFPQIRGMCVLNDDRVILWESPCQERDTVTNIRTIAMDYLINCNSNSNDGNIHKLKNGEVLYLYGTSNEDQKDGVTLALITEKINTSYYKPNTSMNDVLCAITKSISNEIELLSALAASESELNAMASELTDQKIDEVSHYQNILNREESKTKTRMSQLMDEKESKPATEDPDNSSSSYPDDVLWFQDL